MKRLKNRRKKRLEPEVIKGERRTEKPKPRSKGRVNQESIPYLKGNTTQEKHFIDQNRALNSIEIEAEWFHSNICICFCYFYHTKNQYINYKNINKTPHTGSFRQDSSRGDLSKGEECLNS